MSDSPKLCGEMAAFRYTWPGKNEAHICVDHAVQLMNVARAISLPLQLIPLYYGANDPVPTEFPKCQQIIKDSK